MNERKLLIASGIFAATWASIVPQAVVTRVTMTYDESGALDHSAETRVTLWQDALEIVGPNILIGTGFDTYRYMKRVGSYEDTHNIYLKLLVETGIVGVALFLWILLKSIWRGLSLFRHSKDPTAAGLGLGLAGWVVCAAAANAFGDRWTYLQIQGYFWVLAAFVAYYSRLALESPEGEQAESGDSRKTEALFLIPSSQIVPGAGCRRSL